MKAFQAYANKRTSATAATPRAAAEKFFELNPTARKCDIQEGTVDGNFFTVAYSLRPDGTKRQSYRDVKKSDIATLPNE